MTQARARSIEALGLVIVLWGMGRASVVYFTEKPQGAAVWRAHADVSTKVIPNLTYGTTVNSVVMAPRARPQPVDHGKRLSAARISKAQWPAEASIPERAMPTPPFTNSMTVRSGDPSTSSAATDDALSVAASPKRTMNQKPLQGAAWIVWRQDAAGQPLGAGGQLGGSQIGARLLFPFALKDRLRLSLRAYAPLEQLAAYEMAPGISVRPFPAVPVELIAEHRLRGGARAQDAASLFLAGGGSSQKRGSAWRADVYAQAGMVGVRHPMLFADGAAKISRSIGDSRAIGLGLWGGIQPGLKRLDVGPSASTMIGPPPVNMRLTLDWRVRIAGDARPGSGIAITMAKDF